MVLGEALAPLPSIQRLAREPADLPGGAEVQNVAAGGEGVATGQEGSRAKGPVEHHGEPPPPSRPDVPRLVQQTLTTALVRDGCEPVGGNPVHGPHAEQAPSTR